MAHNNRKLETGNRKLDFYVGKIFKYWLPVAVWLSLIALESTAIMSQQNSGYVLYRLLTHWFGPINFFDFHFYYHVVRKIGHFVGYAIFCVLLFRAFRGSFAGRARRWAILAVGVTFLVACADEFHQSLIPSRGASLRDVALDTTGAALIQSLVLWRLRRQCQPAGAEAAAPPQ